MRHEPLSRTSISCFFSALTPNCCVNDTMRRSEPSGSTYEALETWHGKAAGKACIDYGFHMIITDLPDERVPEMAAPFFTTLSVSWIVDDREPMPLPVAEEHRHAARAGSADLS